MLDGNENQAVAAVRSLARAGHAPFTGAETRWSKAGVSRHSRGSFDYPPPAADAAGFVRRVTEEVARGDGALVLPMTELSTLPISAYREAVAAAGGTLVLPPHETVLRAFDKSRTQVLADSLGIATPRTLVLVDRAGADEAARSSHYPVVLKPRASEEVAGSGKIITTGRPRYARDGAELMQAYGAIAPRCSGVLVQEFVEGTGAGFFALMRAGEPRAEFAHRRLRDARPTGSGSALRESVAPDPAVRRAALDVLTALGWHGVAMVEFRVRPDGTPVFLEVNGRFWHSLALAIHAGVDFPALLAELAERGEVAPAGGYRTGVRCRWLLGDTRHLLAVLRGPPPGFPGAFPDRRSTLREFVIPVRGTHHDNFAATDPLPELWDWLDFGLRRVPSALRERHDHSGAASA